MLGNYRLGWALTSCGMPDAEELARIEIVALLAPWGRIIQDKARW